MAISQIRHNRRLRRTGMRTVLRANAYLTDESRLFRCLGWDGSLVLLEDCMTLEAFALPADELANGELRIVRPVSSH